MKTSQDHYLHFSRKERNGIIFLLSLVLLIILTPYIYFLLLQEENAFGPPEYPREIASLKQLAADSGQHFSRWENEPDQKNNFPSFQKEDLSRTLFKFDPNTLDVKDWQALGVKEKTASGIRNYIAKGGRFRQPEDLNKIWGLSDAMKKRLLPYVTIAARDGPAYASTKFGSYAPKQPGQKSTKRFDINKGDTTAFIALPGIGSKLAARIINFRDRLGGFYAVSQVGETFGLPDSTFQKIKPYLDISPGEIRKININTVSLEELKQHPYIRWQLANVIVQYRLQHGNFSSVDDLKKIMIIKEDIFDKISPYCKVE